MSIAHRFTRRRVASTAPSALGAHCAPLHVPPSRFHGSQRLERALRIASFSRSPFCGTRQRNVYRMRRGYYRMRRKQPPSLFFLAMFKNRDVLSITTDRKTPTCTSVFCLRVLALSQHTIASLCSMARSKKSVVQQESSVPKQRALKKAS